INLATPDVEAARQIARAVRASSGGFPHVKALGLKLASRNQAQVSMNLTDFEATPLHTVFEAVAKEAQSRGTEIASTEIIGFLPRKVVEMTAAYFLRCENLESETVLENRLQELMARQKRVTDA
ncbi:MAG: glutamate formimidoyltransferase, partial [Bryobacteraceae bacterium]